MTYTPKHFRLRELVDPHFLAMPDHLVWAMLDDNALRAIDALRDKFGPLLINGAGYTESGLRRPDTKTGAKLSQHKSGRAFDIKPCDDHVTVGKMYAWILANQSQAYAMGIRRVEDIRFTPTWLHIDSKDTGTANVNKIVIVKP